MIRFPSICLGVHAQAWRAIVERIARHPLTTSFRSSFRRFFSKLLGLNCRYGGYVNPGRFVTRNQVRKKGLGLANRSKTEVWIHEHPPPLTKSMTPAAFVGCPLTSSVCLPLERSSTISASLFATSGLSIGVGLAPFLATTMNSRITAMAVPGQHAQATREEAPARMRLGNAERLNAQRSTFFIADLHDAFERTRLNQIRHTNET